MPPAGTSGRPLSLKSGCILCKADPLDGAPLEVHSDAVAVVSRPLAMKHLPEAESQCNGEPVQRSPVPEVFREYTSAVWG